MRSEVKSILCILALSVVMVFLHATPALADGPATKPAALTQIGLAAAKSLDALDAFAKQTGLPLPAAYSADSIETQFTFIGKGGLATDKPIGIVISGRAGLEPDQMIAFVFPMKPTGGTVDSLIKLGAKPMPDHADTFFLGAAGVRRTADYLIYSQTPSVAANVDIDAIQDAVKSGDALVKVTADLKIFRELLPDQYKQMIAGVEADNGLAMVASPVMKALDTFDRIEIGLSNGEQGVRLSFSASPFKLPAITAANRPGMPATVMARVDFGVPAGEALPWARGLIENLKKSADHRPDGQPLNNDQKQLVDFVFARFSDLALNPAVMSVGTEIIAGEPVIYIAQHWTQQIYASDEIQHIADSLNLLAKESNPDNTFAFQSYASDGVPVLRVVAVHGIAPIGALDVAQKGSDVYITIAPNQYRHIRHLMNAKPEGPIKDVMSASVDLGKMVDELSKAKNSPLAGMSADALKQLLDRVHDQTLSAAISTDGDRTSWELAASKGLVQNVPKVLAAFDGSGGTSSGPVADQPSANTAQSMAMTGVRQLLLGCVSYDIDHKAWPNNLDAIADYVGGKEGVAKLMASARTGNFIYHKPAHALKDPVRTIVIHEAFSIDVPTAKVVVGYADGHVVMVTPAEVKRELGAAK